MSDYIHLSTVESTYASRVGVLRDVTRFLKSDWFALYAKSDVLRCTRPSLPVRRRGSARLARGGGELPPPCKVPLT